MTKILVLLLPLFLLACEKKTEAPAPEQAAAPTAEATAAAAAEEAAKMSAKERRMHLNALRGAIIAMDTEVTMSCLNKRLPSDAGLKRHLKAADPNVSMTVTSKDKASCTLKADFAGQGDSKISVSLPLEGEDRKSVGL